MALSDWDTLAFNAKGQASPGEVKNRQGATLEIYKNWLYVRDPKVWRKGDYVKPVIAQINEGNINVSGFNIHAKRCGQNGVMVVAGYHSPKYKRHYYFGGIGCSGYKNDIPEMVAALGLDPNLNWGLMSSSHLDEETGQWMDDTHVYCHIEDGTKIGKVLEYLYESVPEDRENPKWPDWLGVTQETLNEFFEFAESLEDHFYGGEYKTWLKKIRRAEALRYNQGDMFFASHLDDPELIGATPVGETGEPMIQGIIENMTPEQLREHPVAQAIEKITNPEEQGSGTTVAEVLRETTE